MSSSSLLIPTASVATPAVLPPIQGNLAVQGAYAQPILLYMGKAASTDPTQTAPTYAGAAANQPATQTLVFFVPGALATDVVFVSKESSTTPASTIVGWSLANPGAANATYTITLSANEVFAAHFSVWRLA